MKLHEDQEFLQDLLQGEELTALRENSLQQGLAALRRKRRRRFLIRSAVSMCLPLLICGLFFLKRSYPPTTPGAAPLASATPVSDGAIKIINDQELFALFPNRPLALVGKPGHQQLVFLDQVQN